MTVSEYFHIKQQVMLSVSSSDRLNQTINELKEYFKEKINSPRRCEQIKTIGQLLHVLEIRDLLSENNVQALKYIALYLSDQGLVDKLNDYERCHTPKYCNNYYNLENSYSVSQKETFKNVSNKNPYSDMSNRKIQRIHKTVIEQIGTFWRDLARNLKIRECDIDYIDKNYHSLPAKAERMFQIYIDNNADSQKWLLELCEALEKSRRKDLAKTLNHILTMNI
ncbi:uncharacterized protein LOC106132792 isoform X1 [Amyelois transitella]|uniref:uncharacterized protein LOC106132792 isoform X1 n=1 Tax=Amyelois transitella TaxID=680683 RepID=UPI00067C5708|nr:uncharacterized protein LOC106132792 isoform X1 [Amyelois transitella]